MLQHPPRVRPVWAWLAVAAWTLVIYGSIPFARTLQEYVREHWTRDVFTWAVLVCVAAGLAVSLRWVYRLKGQRTRGQTAWLLSVTAAFASWTWALHRSSPEEALHFVEYGILGLLLFRAWATRMHHPAVYLAAWLSAAIIGTVDEGIQWLTPRRFWDLRDVWLNAGSAGLMLVAISKGLVPVYLVERRRPGIVRSVWGLGMVFWLLMAASLFNTPGRIDACRERIPGFRALAKNAGIMAEYGFLYRDPEMGSFKSRLDPATLARTDREQAASAAEVLDRYQDHETYSEFLDTYRSHSHPFIHEARVHLFRRDRYRHSSYQYREKDPAEYRRHLTIVYRENQIVEAYFSNTFAESNYRLHADTLAHIREHLDADEPYYSPVSQGLITAMEPRQVAWMMGLIALAWTGGCLAWSRRVPA